MLAIVMAPVLAKLADVSFKIWRDEDLEGLFPLHESFFFFFFNACAFHVSSEVSMT